MYGLDNYNEFNYEIINECGDGGGGAGAHATILEEIKIIPSDHEMYEKMDRYIDAAKKYDPRIFILLLKDQDIAAQFIVRAYSKGLLNANSFTWGTIELTNANLLDKISGIDGGSGAAAAAAAAANILKTIGYFGISTAESDWKYYEKGHNFINKLRSLPSSFKSRKKDDDGDYLYYIDGINVGANYSKFTFDDIDPYAAYAYDATYALVYSILNLTGSGNISQRALNGSDVISSFEDNVRFEGITGTISISQRNGMKFRNKGIKYAIVNFNGSHFNRVGTYDDEFILCNKTFYLPGGCFSIEYGTPGNTIPTDAPRPYTKYMPDAMKSASLFFAIFLLLNIAFYASWMIIYRKNKILKVSQLPISWSILFFAVFAAFRIIFNIVDPSTEMCYIEYIFGHMTFMGLIVLFIKSARVYIIVNLSKLRKIKITNTHTLRAIFSFFVMMVIFLMGMIVFRTIYVDTVSKTYINGQVVYENFCNSYKTVDYILWSFEGPILVITAKLAYDMRNIPDTINESKLIAMCIFLITIIIIIGMVFTQILDFEPHIDSFIVSICFFIAEICYLNVYFGPKFYLIYNGADLDKKFNIIYPKKVVIVSSIELQNQYQDDTEKIKNKYLTGEPKTNNECEILINILNNIKLKLNSNDMLASASGGGGNSSNKPSGAEDKSRFRAGSPSRSEIDVTRKIENLR